MIPYGLYVLTTKSKDGTDLGAATVNWVTQASFAPPLVVVGVKADSGAHQDIKYTGVFAINVLGKDQLDMEPRSSAHRTRGQHAQRPAVRRRAQHGRALAHGRSRMVGVQVGG